MGPAPLGAPLTWLYRARMLVQFTMEDGNVWNDPTRRRQFLGRAQRKLEEYRNAFPENRFAAGRDKARSKGEGKGKFEGQGKGQGKTAALNGYMSGHGPRDVESSRTPPLPGGTDESSSGAGVGSNRNRRDHGVGGAIDHRHVAASGMVTKAKGNALLTATPKGRVPTGMLAITVLVMVSITDTLAAPLSTIYAFGCAQTDTSNREENRSSKDTRKCTIAW